MSEFKSITANTVKFKKLRKSAIIPKRMSEKASGLDLFAYIPEQPQLLNTDESRTILLYPSDRVVISTGITMELPEGYEAQVRSRSGLSAKNGICVLNSPGTIDEDYRGEIKVILLNTDRVKTFTIKHGDRIAQLVISKVCRLPYTEVEELSDTERGEGGLGSTGV